MAQPHEADWNCPARRYSGALLLWAIAGLLVACGGGGEPAPADSTSSIVGTLAWDPVNDPNLAGYRIYYGSAPGTYLQPIGQGLNVGNVTTYTVTATGLSSGTTYYFAATAYDTSNNESVYSNEIFKVIP